MLETLLTHAPYLGVAAVLLASGFGAPIPEDIPLILGGYFCHTGHASIYIMLPLTFIAVIGADVIIYYLGRRYGQQIPRLPIIRRFLTPERLVRAQASFHKHGGKTIFVGRFLPGLRAPIFFTAGTFRISAWRFIASDGLAALISVPLLVLAGYFFGEYLDVVKRSATQLQIAVLITMVILIAAFIWYQRRNRRAASSV